MSEFKEKKIQVFAKISESEIEGKVMVTIVDCLKNEINLIVPKNLTSEDAVIVDDISFNSASRLTCIGFPNVATNGKIYCWITDKAIKKQYFVPKKKKGNNFCQ